jgi:hypothetical protein
VQTPAHFFFEGVDPAPSDKQSADDGALVIGRATPKWPTATGEVDWERMTDNPADWWFDYIYARRLTWKEKASAEQWAGIIHQHHRAFGMSRIVLDPGGGGIYVERALAQPVQSLGGVDTEVTPIVTPGSVMVTRGHHLLHFCRRSDPGILAVWPEMKDAAGDDVLNDALYSLMRDALERGAVAFLPPWDDWWGQHRAETARLPEESQWTLKNFTAALRQFTRITVAMRGDGTYALTRRQAKQFDAVGKKDLVSACMYCYLAFQIWLRMGEWRALNRKTKKTFRVWK